MSIKTPTFAELLKAAQESALQGMSDKAPPPAEKSASKDQDTLSSVATKVAAHDLDMATWLRKMASDAGTSPGVSQAKVPEDLPTSLGAATNNKPGLGKSSTSVQGPTGGPTGLEVSQAKAAGGASVFSRFVKEAAEPGPAIGGGTSPGTSSAEQSTGQPAGGKPQGPRHLIASTMAAINATAKDTYEPRKEEMRGLISQTMNENDKTHQVFDHHAGAKTAADKGEDLSIKTASADELLRRLEAQIQGQVSA